MRRRSLLMSSFTRKTPLFSVNFTKKINFSHFAAILCLLFSFLLAFTACQKEEQPKKVKDLDFTMVSGTDIPDNLQELIRERKQANFNLTYNDGNFLYIIKGYGKQPTGGYSISVKSLYLSAEDIVLATKLIGPKQPQEGSHQSYPYVVLKTEEMDKNVSFYEK